jgi:hypothetical protein
LFERASETPISFKRDNKRSCLLSAIHLRRDVDLATDFADLHRFEKINLWESVFNLWKGNAPSALRVLAALETTDVGSRRAANRSCHLRRRSKLSVH